MLEMSEKKEKMLSDEQIGKMVENIMATDKNIKYLPDAVEKQIYINVLKMVLNIVDECVDGTSFQFLNHKVRLSMHPIGHN
jgi:hypothetical protein